MKPINVKGKGRHYKSPETGKLLPSVTNILGCYPKQRLLVPWSANVQVEFDLDKARDVYNSQEHRDGDHFRQRLDMAIGKSRAHKMALDKGSNIGTAVHEAIANKLKAEMGLGVNEHPTLEGPALYAYMSWENWWQKSEIQPIAVEKFVYSDVLGYAGTTDLIADVTLSQAILARVNPKITGPLGHHLGKKIRMNIDFKTGKAIYEDMMPQLAAYMYALTQMGMLDSDSWGMIVRLPKVEDDPEFEVGLLMPDDRQRKLNVFLATKTIWEDKHNG